MAGTPWTDEENDAIVADYPGLTRDRQYGFGKVGPVPYLVIDTGGVAGGEEGIDEIGASVGYDDPASFRRMFKRRTGLTPAAYRRKFQRILSLGAA